MTPPAERLLAALADRYRIERELGSAGMATVYLAYDLRHGREVAIKVMRPELASTMGTERFLREIQLVAGLSHPHILPLFDSGEAGGSFYYVMPKVSNAVFIGDGGDDELLGAERVGLRAAQATWFRGELAGQPRHIPRLSSWSEVLELATAG